ncbi:MAG: HAMP domain-containing protein [Rhodanobacteraceae bacterium]|nr:HAMP domain-containing protein [Rhodanobacteraceae bacterium]
MPALLRPRGIFIKLSVMIVLSSQLVLLFIGLIELSYSPARFEWEVNDVMADLRQQIQARPPSLDTCQPVADQLWRELIIIAAGKVTDFVEAIEMTLREQSAVRIVGPAGIICQSGAVLSPMLSEGLHAAEASGERLHSYRQAGEQVVIARLQLSGTPPRYALAGLHFSSTFLQGTATVYDSLRTLVVLCMMGISVAGVVVLVVVRRVRRAAGVAQRWAEGDLTARIRDRAADEISDLTAHFDQMAMTLEQTMRANRELAARVERNRIARDLHDTVKQRTFVLGIRLAELDLRLRQAREASIQPLISDARLLLDHIQDDLSRLLQEQPGSGGFTDLHAEIERCVAGLLGDGVRFAIELPQLIEKKIMAHPRVAAEILAITLESAANAGRHSNCSVFALRVVEEGAIHWHIEDNGKGFDASRRYPGMGLGNLRWRAESLPGGVLQIHSDAAGTRIDVAFVLAERDTE